MGPVRRPRGRLLPKKKSRTSLRCAKGQDRSGQPRARERAAGARAVMAAEGVLEKFLWNYGKKNAADMKRIDLI